MHINQSNLQVLQEYHRSDMANKAISINQDGALSMRSSEKTSFISVSHHQLDGTRITIQGLGDSEALQKIRSAATLAIASAPKEALKSFTERVIEESDSELSPSWENVVFERFVNPLVDTK